MQKKQKSRSEITNIHHFFRKTTHHFILLFLCLIWALGFSGCKFYEQAKSMILGGGEGEPKISKMRPVPRRFDPTAEKIKFDAINKVKKTKTRGNWTIEKEVNRYQKIAAKIAKRKHLPKPTGFEWSAICAKGGSCKVSMGFWDGRQPLQAMWFVSSDVLPLNCWAYSFTAQIKKARACFEKQAAKAAKAADKIRKKAAGGDIWMKSSKGKRKKNPKTTTKKTPLIISPRSAANRR